MPLVVYFWLFAVFVLGAIVGSFLNVAIARLPLEKSVLWPSSRCGSCYQPIRWYDNLPLISYWWLRGRCRSCGAEFSARYFFVELLTACGFALLFYLEVVVNLHSWPGFPFSGFFPVAWWIGFTHHAALFSFLMVASVCDLDGREIPFRLTFTGTIVGLVGSVFLPWPWPWDPPIDAHPPAILNIAWQWQNPPIKEGIYPWPFWGPLPAFCGDGGNWQTGLLTGVIGALVGTFFVRGVAFVFSKGLGKEALGLGDADLMMMVGAFLGWQIVVVGFFVSVIPGLFIGLFQIIFRGDNSLPFGPSLAAGVIIAYEGWPWIGPYLQPILFWGSFLAILAVAAALFMLLSSLLIRVMRREG